MWRKRCLPTQGRFPNHALHAEGTTLTKVGLVWVETVAQYIEFAVECDRLVADTQSERHRKILEEMAQVWRKLARDAETKSAKI
jgi:hypothetical protein